MTAMSNLLSDLRKLFQITKWSDDEWTINKAEPNAEHDFIAKAQDFPHLTAFLDEGSPADALRETLENARIAELEKDLQTAELYQAFWKDMADKWREMAIKIADIKCP